MWEIILPYILPFLTLVAGWVGKTYSTLLLSKINKRKVTGDTFFSEFKGVQAMTEDYTESLGKLAAKLDTLQNAHLDLKVKLLTVIEESRHKDTIIKELKLENERLNGKVTPDKNKD